MSRLGRGLNSLIKDIEVPASSGAISTVNIEFVKPNRYQPRRQFNQEKLMELAESIKENGLIQPLVVDRQSDTEYELIAGERRLAACKLAGIAEVPVYVKEVTDRERLVLAIIENVQREDLSPIEEAKAYNQLIEEFGLTHLELSKIMSKDRVTVTNTLRLLKLSEKIQQMIEEKMLTPGHARIILGIDEEFHEEFAEDIVRKQFTTRKAEEQAQNYNNIVRKAKPTSSKKALDNPYIKSVEKELSTTLSSIVKIKEKKNASGEILIQFRDKENLENIVNSLKVSDTLHKFLVQKVTN